MSNTGNDRSAFLTNAQIIETAEIEMDREVLFGDFGTRFVGFGSCFALNIRRHLESFGFNFFFTSEISAHYNTETLANILEFIAGEREPSEADLYEVGPEDVFLYRCHFKHRFYGKDAKERALARMRGLIAAVRAALEETDVVLVTLGTARVLRLNANSEVIAAAIQVPAEHWRLETLSLQQNLANLRRILASLAKICRKRPLRVFFTVSPQRYLFGHVMRPGSPSYGGTALVDNFLGKAMLRVAVEQTVAEGYGDLDLRYFPAFEIVYEELRQFETLAHYDFVHIDQVHTPERVVKKFLAAYASDGVLDQIVALTRVRGELHEMGRLLTGGMAKDAPEIRRRVDAMLGLLSSFGEDLCPPGIGLTYHLVQTYCPDRSIRDLRFRHLGFGNRLALARDAAAGGEIEQARRMTLELMEALAERRSQDPDAGRDIEHRVYDEAAAFLQTLGPVPAASVPEQSHA